MLSLRSLPPLLCAFLIGCDADETTSTSTTTGTAVSSTGSSPESSAAVGGGGGAGGSMGAGGTGGTGATGGGGIIESTFVSYLGGSAFEQARDVTVDDAGNIITVGGTASADFPVTAGAYDTTFATGGSSLGSGGPMDVFVAKYSSSGQLLWATFVGGPNYDRAYAVEVDAAGDVYVAGRAGDQFPTTQGALQPSFAGDTNANGLYGLQDGFVFKLSSDGTTLLWSTYFGGPSYEFIRDMDIDASGNVYVGVAGAASTFPHITSGAYDTSHNGGIDAVLAKLSADGTQLLWSTFFGGSGTEGVPSVRVNAAGELFLGTSSDSTNLPTTSGAYQTGKKSGTDFFVAKMSADGASLAFCTWFGGNSNESAETHHIALDPSGSVVIAAETQSTDLPTTSNAHKSSLSGPGDAFIAKLAPNGGALLAATYLGGNGWDAIQGVAVDGAGNIYVGGTTPSDNLPATGTAYQSTYGGNGDGWAAWLSPDVSTIHHLTYLGAGQDDQQRSLWIDAAGNIVSTGQSASAAFPVTPAAAQSSYAGNVDAYIAAFKIH